MDSEKSSQAVDPAATIQALQYIRPAAKFDREFFPRSTDEYICRRSDKKLNLSLLITESHNHMRIVDYRLGQYKLKCSIFDQLAVTKSLKKVFTLVEKQDSNSWRTVGFSKEAVIPGYFRNADAYVMSRVYDTDGKPVTGGLAKLVHEKGVEFEIPAPPMKKPNGLKTEVIDDPDKLREIVNSKEAHSCYNPFGIGIIAPQMVIEARQGRRNLWVGAEVNEAFGHAKIDVLVAPKNSKDRRYLSWMLIMLLEELVETYDVSSVFGFSLVEEPSIGQIYTDSNFKVTGQLSRHMVSSDGKVSDVYMWHRKTYKGNIRPLPE
ncbi:MAG: hypothetical protein JXR95_10050 [Deltaproteobacteria bacterium]|nr:hypothetical protein [Deltaproteobacteria bacterium]